MKRILKRDKSQRNTKTESRSKRHLLQQSSRLEPADPQPLELPISGQGLQTDQAEAGLLRETYKENKLSWSWNRAGVIDEAKISFKNVLQRSATRLEYVKFDRGVPAETKEHPSGGEQERYIRCYVIAPYDDMQAERRLLAQEVFPTLRVRCLQIGVHFAEVDFGWGVTQNISERNSGILNRLLEMRQNVRTYVVGLLGERYGYKYLHNTAVDEGFLDPLFLSKRPTVLGLQEVELDEGLLSLPPSFHRAFFYFRDARYFDQVDSKDVRISLASEGLLSRERLSNLKNKIRMSSIPVKENYSDPEEAAALILADLSDQIAKDFPQDYTSEHASLSDATIAEEYEKSVLKSFFGRETEMKFVDERILGIQTYPLPLIVCGDVGVGKTSFLVAWSKRFLQQNSVDLLFKHYSDLNHQNSRLNTLLFRILREMKTALNLRAEIPNDAQQLASTFAAWINALPFLSAKVVLVIDGIDCVIDSIASTGNEPPKESRDKFNWLPEKIPPNTRLILSCCTGSEAYQVLTARNWPTYHMQVLDKPSREQLIINLMKARGLRLPRGAFDRLVKRHQAQNPLFLIQILRGIRTPEDIKPSGSMGLSLFSRSVKDLFDVVLDGLERGHRIQERCGLTEDFMSFVALSRRGLSEFELLDILQVPRAIFSSFFLAVSQILKVSCGLFTIAHALCLRAIEDKYLSHLLIRKSVRLRIVEYFQSRPVTHRTVDEVPWQLFHCRQWQELATSIMNPHIFFLLFSTDEGRFDLMIYWSQMLSGEIDSSDLNAKCDQCLSLANEFSFSFDEKVDLCLNLADMLQMLGFFDSSLPFIRRANHLQEATSGLNSLMALKYKIREASVMVAKREYARAETIYESALSDLRIQIDRNEEGFDRWEDRRRTEGAVLLPEIEEEYLILLWKSKQFSKLENQCISMLCYKGDRKEREYLLLDSLVYAYLERGELDRATRFLKLCISTTLNSPHDHQMQVLSRTIGILLMQEQYKTIVNTINGCEWLWNFLNHDYFESGNDTCDVVPCEIVGIYGFALCHMGRSEEGLKLLQRSADLVSSESGNEEEELPASNDAKEEELQSSNERQPCNTGEDNESRYRARSSSWIYSTMLLDLVGVVYRQLNLFTEAETFHKRSLNLKVLTSGSKDPSISYTINEMACLHECMRHQADAVRLRKVASRISLESQGYFSIFHFKSLLSLSVCYWKFEEFLKAEQLAQTVLAGVESRYGSNHELISSACLVLATIQVSLNKLSLAKENLTRTQRLAVNLWGVSHSDSIEANFVLSQLHECAGDFDLAEAALLQTKKQREETSGRWCVGSKNDIMALAFLYFRVGALVEAEGLLRDALPGIQMVHGSFSLEVACLLTILALIGCRLRDRFPGRPGDVCTIALRAFRIRHGVLDEGSLHFVQHAIFTALLLELEGSCRFAEPLFRKALSCLDHPSSSHLMVALYAHYEASNRLGFSSDEWRPLLPFTEFTSSFKMSSEKKRDNHDPLFDAVVQSQNVDQSQSNSGSFEKTLITKVPLKFRFLQQEEDLQTQGMKHGTFESTLDSIQADYEIAGISSNDSTEQKFNDEQFNGAHPTTQRPSSAPSVLIVTSKETNGSVDPPRRPMSSTLNAKSKSDTYKVLSRRFAATGSYSARQSMQMFTADTQEERMLTPMGKVGKRDAKGNTLLHEAVENSHIHDITSLIESGASVNAANRAAETPIHIVCRLGRLDLLQLLCSGTEDVNFGGANGFTALHYAVKSGSVDMVRFLVENCKADILAEDDDNQTPLELALLQEGEDLTPIIEFLRRANDLLPSF